jgi:hypothetical protein
MLFITELVNYNYINYFVFTFIFKKSSKETRRSWKIKEENSLEVIWKREKKDSVRRKS